MIPDRKCPVCDRKIEKGAIATRSVTAPHPEWTRLFVCDAACLRAYRAARADA